MAAAVWCIEAANNLTLEWRCGGRVLAGGERLTAEDDAGSADFQSGGGG
jgi:hypothetical protein